MIKLSKRLEIISSLVPINSKIIDIGCDHALLDIYMYQMGCFDKIIASDVNINAINNAKYNIELNKLTNKIELRLGSGLDVLNDKDNIDTLIISGMGTYTIIEILKNNLKKLKKINTLIIQSNTKIPYLRKEINKLGYLINDEIIIEDNEKIYTTIKFTKGYKKYKKNELFLGPILLEKKDEIFIKNTSKELKKLKSLLKKIPKKHFIERIKIIKQIKMYEKSTR